MDPAISFTDLAVARMGVARRMRAARLSAIMAGNPETFCDPLPPLSRILAVMETAHMEYGNLRNPLPGADFLRSVSRRFDRYRARLPIKQ